MESAPAKAGLLGDEAFEHVKRFMLSLALVREDIGFSLNHRSFSVGQVSLKNAFGEPMDSDAAMRLLTEVRLEAAS